VIAPRATTDVPQQQPDAEQPAERPGALLDEAAGPLQPEGAAQPALQRDHHAGAAVEQQQQADAEGGAGAGLGAPDALLDQAVERAGQVGGGLPEDLVAQREVVPQHQAEDADGGEQQREDREERRVGDVDGRDRPLGALVARVAAQRHVQPAVPLPQAGDRAGRALPQVGSRWHSPLRGTVCLEGGPSIGLPCRSPGNGVGRSGTYSRRER
jgi:hypothetical protein